MRLFLTGGAGFVGRNCLDWLLQHQPHLHITALVRDEAKARAQWPQPPANLTFLPGDLLAPATYQAVAQQADYVLHAAALVSLKNGPDFYRLNTEATACLLAALQDSPRLRRFVFVSSIAAIDRPRDRPAVGPLTLASPACPGTDYGRSKQQAEERVRQSGLPYCILRPAYIYGPHPRAGSSVDKLIRDVAAGKAYTRFPFPGRVSAIHALELAARLWTAATHPATENQTFFAADTQAWPVREVFQQVTQALALPWRPRRDDLAMVRRFQSRWYARQPDSLTLRILCEDFFLCDSTPWDALTGAAPSGPAWALLREAAQQALALDDEWRDPRACPVQSRKSLLE